MEDGFELPVVYRNEECLFPARLLQLGYTFRVEVDIRGRLFNFEPDEERNWRALLPYGDEDRKAIDVELLRAVAEALESITK
jgi:hypothetical protein